MGIPSRSLLVQQRGWTSQMALVGKKIVFTVSTITPISVQYVQSIKALMVALNREGKAYPMRIGQRVE